MEGGEERAAPGPTPSALEPRWRLELVLTGGASPVRWNKQGAWLTALWGLMEGLARHLQWGGGSRNEALKLAANSIYCFRTRRLFVLSPPPHPPIEMEMRAPPSQNEPGCFQKWDVAPNEFQTPQKFIRKQRVIKGGGGHLFYLIIS